MGNYNSSSADDDQSKGKTSTTGSATATQNLEVANYSQLDGIGVGKSIRSSTFAVGGYDWCIRFYPDGYSADDAGHVSSFLHCLSNEQHAKASFTLSMFERDGDVEVTGCRCAERIFSPQEHTWGFHRFVEKSRLNSVNDGTLTIRCIVVVAEPRVQEAKRNPIAVPPTDLHVFLGHMLKDGEGADVTFSVRGRLFKAHRCVMAARSPVFKALLFGPMKKKASQCVEIDDMEPSIFDALLRFVYTDCMPDDYEKEGKTEDLQHLLVAADQYGADRLRVMCESKLCDIFSTETVATTLLLAEQHHCNDLKQACIDFMAPGKTLRAVMKTDGFKHLEETCPLLMKDILSAVSGLSSD